ncbi:MAG: hypothetical protein ACI865_001216 [Flavobacteriaceae bacterium]|jgi:hypothetical protein
MGFEFKLSNSVKGGLIYAAGDTIAVLIVNGFDFSTLSWIRIGGILLIGATLYTLEIPNYFKWIDKKLPQSGTGKNAWLRASMAMLYFNPLWIARHIVFIQLLAGGYETIGWTILLTGVISFAVNIPVSLIANYLIQNKVGSKHRFLASAIFSGLMAIYYSLSNVLFT